MNPSTNFIMKVAESAVITWVPWWVSNIVCVIHVYIIKMTYLDSEYMITFLANAKAYSRHEPTQCSLLGHIISPWNSFENMALMTKYKFLSNVYNVYNLCVPSNGVDPYISPMWRHNSDMTHMHFIKCSMLLFKVYHKKSEPTFPHTVVCTCIKDPLSLQGFADK